MTEDEIREMVFKLPYRDRKEKITTTLVENMQGYVE